MIYNIKEKNISLGTTTKEKITNKLSRIEKLFPNDATAVVKISLEKQNYTVEITIPISKRLVRAEVTQRDMVASLDKAIDIVENQIIRHKGRIKSKIRHSGAFKDEYETIPIAEELLPTNNDHILIEKNKRFELRPMDAEEAIMQMELLGHMFFVFLSSQTETINVVYKRKNGTYGLIEPEA